MGNRAITTGRQLGAAIHDARTRAGLTQASLATSAGVSRKWLIGLEQGARTGAELSKVLAVLRALDLSIQLIEQPEQDEAGSPQAKASTPGTVSAQKIRDSTTSEARKALNIMRQYSAPSRTTLDVVRQAAQVRPELLETMRQAAQLPTELLETIRQATKITGNTLPDDHPKQDDAG